MMMVIGEQPIKIKKLQPAQIIHTEIQRNNLSGGQIPPTNPIKVKTWLTDNFCSFHLSPRFV